jgi:hypothetical protein
MTDKEIDELVDNLPDLPPYREMVGDQIYAVSNSSGVLEILLNTGEIITRGGGTVHRTDLYKTHLKNRIKGGDTFLGVGIVHKRL